MKLRKNEIISPKNFPEPPWRMKSPYRGISDFLHREVDERILLNALSLRLYPSTRTCGELTSSRASRRTSSAVTSSPLVQVCPSMTSSSSCRRKSMKRLRRRAVRQDLTLATVPRSSTRRRPPRPLPLSNKRLAEPLV